MFEQQQQQQFLTRYPDDYLNLIASKLKDKTAWGDIRNARFAKLLQFSLARYFKGGLNMCRVVVAGLTKVLYKVSAHHEFMSPLSGGLFRQEFP